LAGQAAVTRNGRAYSVGAWSLTLLESVLAEVLTDAGVAVMRLPEGVRVSRRGGTEVWTNFNQEPATLPDGTTMGPVSFWFRGQVDRSAHVRQFETQG
jgi:beta-galactosidase